MNWSPTRPCDRCGLPLDPATHDCVAALLEALPKWEPMEAFDLPDFVTVLLTLEEWPVAVVGYHGPKGWVIVGLGSIEKPIRFMRMPEPWKEAA